MTELEAPGVGEHPPPYIIFVVVFLFFLTGLLGFLICHLLKKKGYRCRTGDMEDEDDEEEEKLQTNADDEDEENQDTVEQILKCIIENEANMEAFNEMLGNRNVCVRHDPRLRKESVGGVPPHHHTVHSGIDSCHLCAQGRSKKGRRQSRTPRFKQRPGEQTVFSVGRFRVTHNDKKLHGGPNQLVSSGDQLDQSQDSEERKEGGYNLRSMFKDVRPPSESSNGVAPNVGKRRKSLTIFGLRRGSDPSGTKAGEATGKESGGVRFAIQQQPVVLEELLQAGTEVAPERETKPGIKPETKPASPQRQAKTSGPVCSPSSQSKNQDSRSAADGGPKHGPSPKSRTNLVIKPSVGSKAASVPSSLPIESPASSGQTFKATDRGEDPGPLQTSTPIAPIHGPIPGLTAVIPTGQPETNSPTGFPVTQTPPDPSSSSDLEPGLGVSLALISLGSSPPSSYPIKTPSSVSLLKTPTSPATPSPKLSSRNTPSEAAKSGLSPALTPSPKLPSGRAMTSQPPIPSSSLGKSSSPLQGRTPSPALPVSPKLDTTPVSLQAPSSPADQDPSFGSSPRLTSKAGSVTPVTSSPVSLKNQEPEGARIPETGAKTEVKRAGILKKPKLSPVEGDSRSSHLSSPAEQLFQDRLSSLPLSPSSPAGGRISSVAVIKASPDSKREFSVVTMVEEEGSSPELGVESEAGVGQPENQRGGTSEAEFSPTVSQERDDMVEMEDIRDCKVTQVEEVEKEEEKMVNI